MPTVCPPVILAGDPTGKYCFKCEVEMFYEEHQHPRIIDESVVKIICPECNHELEEE